MQFKHEIEEEIGSVLELNQTSSSEIFFNITHIKQAIKNSKKSSEVSSYFTALPISCRQVILSRTSQNWKKENRINLKKLDKESYHLENSYHSIPLPNIFGKIYERIILQLATNILEENTFFKGKNLYAYQKNKNASQALLPLIE